MMGCCWCWWCDGCVSDPYVGGGRNTSSENMLQRRCIDGDDNDGVVRLCCCLLSDGVILIGNKRKGRNGNRHHAKHNKPHRNRTHAHEKADDRNRENHVLLGGIEPPSTDSKSAIIPLDHRRITYELLVRNCPIILRRNFFGVGQPKCECIGVVSSRCQLSFPFNPSAVLDLFTFKSLKSEATSTTTTTNTNQSIDLSVLPT